MRKLREALEDARRAYRNQRCPVDLGGVADEAFGGAGAPGGPRRRRRWAWGAVAAAVLVGAIAGGLWLEGGAGPAGRGGGLTEGSGGDGDGDGAAAGGGIVKGTADGPTGGAGRPTARPGRWPDLSLVRRPELALTKPMAALEHTPSWPTPPKRARPLRMRIPEMKIDPGGRTGRPSRPSPEPSDPRSRLDESKQHAT